MKQLKLYLPIYEVTINIVIAEDIKESMKDCKMTFEDDNFRAIAITTSTKEYYMFLPGNKDFTDVSINDVVHESKHIVNMIFQAHSIELDTGNDEYECYFLAALVTKIHSFIIKLKNKDKTIKYEDYL